MPEFAPDKSAEAQKRRSTRIVQAVPLTVTGVDALGRPFQERTSTLIINCHGCRYQSKHYVLKNMWVTLEIPHPESGQPPRTVRGRVTWIQRPRTVRELFQIGLELETPGNVWGIAFPPADWFPFPETLPLPQVPELVPPPEAEAPAKEEGEEKEEAWQPAAAEAHEDNLRVLPTPATAEASATLGRQVTRLVADAKQQIEGAVREAATQAVAAEVRPLITALQNQLREAAEKTVQAAASAYVDQLVPRALAKLEEANQAGVAAVREEWNRELQQRLKQSGEQLAAQLSQLEQASRGAFDQHLEDQLRQAAERLSKLTDIMGASVVQSEATIERFRKSAEDAAQAADRRWQELLGGRGEEARSKLESLEKNLQRLNDEVAQVISAAQAGWRTRLDADLATAGNVWKQRIESSLEAAAQQAAERLSRNSEGLTSRLEQDLSQRVVVLRQAFEQVAANAESTLGPLREALSKETSLASTTLGEIQHVATRLEEYSGKLSAINEAAAEEFQRRAEGLIASQTVDLERRAEGALSGLAQRLQPMLETAGQQTVAQVAGQLEQQIGAQLERANQAVTKLLTGVGQSEEVLHAHQERLQQASVKAVQEAMAHLQESARRFEKEFQEAGRAAVGKWLAELDAKSTETTHNTFEALYKSAEWYEKKVQTQMQTCLDKGMEQASGALREKAAELSGLFASELNHYSRSYVEHTQGQMDEAVKDAVERSRGLLGEIVESTSTTIREQAQRVTQSQLDRFTASANAAFEGLNAHLQSNVAQIGAKLDADHQQLLADFRKGLLGETQLAAARARQELQAQTAAAKDAVRVEREAQEKLLRDTVAHLGDDSIENYKKRLENASNSWLVTTVSKLNQQSQDIIAHLAAATEQRLRDTCTQVFASVGDTLRQRLLDLSASFSAFRPPEEKK